jgi:hypothetical protein
MINKGEGGGRNDKKSKFFAEELPFTENNINNHMNAANLLKENSHPKSD